MARSLGTEILKNLGLPNKTRVALESWMDNVETKLANLESGHEALAAAHNDHCALTAGSVHGAADETNDGIAETVSGTAPSH